MKQIINGKKFDTDKADAIATDNYWDGSNYQRRYRVLYRTAKGVFFVFYYDNDGQDQIEPITQDKAIEIFSEIADSTETEHFAEIFGFEPEEA